MPLNLATVSSSTSCWHVRRRPRRAIGLLFQLDLRFSIGGKFSLTAALPFSSSGARSRITAFLRDRLLLALKGWNFLGSVSRIANTPRINHSFDVCTGHQSYRPRISLTSGMGQQSHMIHLTALGCLWLSLPKTQ